MGQELDQLAGVTTFRAGRRRLRSNVHSMIHLLLELNFLHGHFGTSDELVLTQTQCQTQSDAPLE